MKILVTGGFGFIGSHIVDRLMTMGHDTVVLEKHMLGDQQLIRKKHLIDKYPDLKIHNANIEFKVQYRDLFEEQRFDKVIHLAGITGVRDVVSDESFTLTNVYGTEKIMKAAHESGVKHVIHASSSSVYGFARMFPSSENMAVSPASPYAQSKEYAEYTAKYYRDYMTVTTLRYFTTYGPSIRMNMAPFIFAKNQLTGKRSSVMTAYRDYTYVDDIVNATLIATLDYQLSDVFNIGTGQMITNQYLMERIQEISGKNVPYDTVNKTSLSEPFLTLADNRKFYNATGFRPTTDFDNGIEIFMDWFKKNVS